MMQTVERYPTPRCSGRLWSLHLRPIGSIPKPSLRPGTTIRAPFVAIPAEKAVAVAIFSYEHRLVLGLVVLQQSSVVAANRLVSAIDPLPSLTVILPGFSCAFRVRGVEHDPVAGSVECDFDVSLGRGPDGDIGSASPFGAVVLPHLIASSIRRFAAA